MSNNAHFSHAPFQLSKRWTVMLQRFSFIQVHPETNRSVTNFEDAL